MNHLKHIIEPKTVAVIGASSKEESIGKAIFQNLISTPFNGTVYPVNPNYTNILSIKTYNNINEIIDNIDLAVICVPAKKVIETIKDCGQKKVKGLIIISSGFKEIGLQGEKLEIEIRTLSKHYEMPLIGPNCLGIVNTDSLINLNANFAFPMPQSGSVALISQSGAIGIAALDYAHKHRLGLSKFVSIGNKAVMDESDILEYLIEDDKTKIIALYVENIINPTRFISLANKASLIKKPIIVIKTGRSVRGASATKSHTGALSSSDTAYDSLFAQCGVIRVETLAELFEYAKGFTCFALPKGKKVAVITNAGGMGIIATDAAERNHLEMANFEKSTLDELKIMLPLNSGINNPVDLGGDADTKRFKESLAIICNDKSIDALVVSVTPTIKSNLNEIAELLLETAKKNPQIPILANLMSLSYSQDFNSILEKASIPNFDFPEVNIRILAIMAKYNEWINQAPSLKPFIKVNQEPVTNILTKIKKEKRIKLTETETYHILSAYGMQVAAYKESVDLKSALLAASEIGYPVVLKIISPDVQHKLEVGGIKINLKNENELKKAFEEINKSIKSSLNPIQTSGYLVQKHISDKGVEVIAGANDTKGFGSLIMFGLGGTYVELFHDVSFRLSPLSQNDAKHLIESTKGYQILKGFRGQTSYDLEAIIQYLLRLSRLVEDFPEIKEIEMNPIKVLEDAKGILIMDAKAVLKEEFLYELNSHEIKKEKMAL